MPDRSEQVERILNGQTPLDFNEEIKRVLGIFASHAGVAIEIVRLHQSAQLYGGSADVLKTNALQLHLKLEETPRPPIELNPSIPANLSDLVLRGLEKVRAELRWAATAYNLVKLMRRWRPANPAKAA